MVVLDGASLTIDSLAAVAEGGDEVVLAPAARERMAAAREIVEEALRSEAAVYGLTTALAERKSVVLDAGARQPDDPLSGAAPAGQSPRLAAHHAEIAQATGMLTEQLGVSISVAFARLRAYAYAQDKRLSDVAHDIVTRRLRLDPDPPGDGET